MRIEITLTAEKGEDFREVVSRLGSPIPLETVDMLLAAFLSKTGGSYRGIARGAEEGQAVASAYVDVKRVNRLLGSTEHLISMWEKYRENGGMGKVSLTYDL